MNVATIATGAWLRDDEQDFTPYVGQSGKSKPYKVRVLDQESDAALGYLGEEGTGETTGGTIVVNGTMEADANWGGAGTYTTCVRSGVQKHSGTYSWLLTLGAAAWGGVKTDTAFSAAMQAGGLYKVSGWIYPVTVSYIYLDVRDGNGATFIISERKIDGLTLNTWNYFEIYVTALTTGTGATNNIRFRTTTADHPAGSWYFDDVAIERMTEADANIGVRIYSTKHGSTQSWASTGANFDPNDTLTYHVWEATSTTSSSTTTSTTSSSTCTTTSSCSTSSTTHTSGG